MIRLDYFRHNYMFLRREMVSEMKTMLLGVLDHLSKPLAIPCVLYRKYWKSLITSLNWGLLRNSMYGISFAHSGIFLFASVMFSFTTFSRKNIFCSNRFYFKAMLAYSRLELLFVRKLPRTRKLQPRFNG